MRTESAASKASASSAADRQRPELRYFLLVLASGGRDRTAQLTLCSIVGTERDTTLPRNTCDSCLGVFLVRRLLHSQDTNSRAGQVGGYGGLPRCVPVCAGPQGSAAPCILLLVGFCSSVFLCSRRKATEIFRQRDRKTESLLE